MTTQPLTPTSLEAATHQDIIEDISQQLVNDPNIISFQVKVNKRTGTIQVNARHTDGRIIYYEEPVPGLSQTTRYDPNTTTIAQRDNIIIHLLNEGCSQTEVAQLLGISQSRVSQISRSSR